MSLTVCDTATEKPCDILLTVFTTCEICTVAMLDVSTVVFIACGVPPEESTEKDARVTFAASEFPTEGEPAVSVLVT